ncbi:MAG: 3-oxoacyl-ACP reductase FabG [Chloroflexi bacterium]|nr:3-oxoacyl-ACP reductase FabG [Chloroflexota bacterium]
MNFTGSRTLITGASRGIGKAIALALAARGGKVGINYANNASAASDVAQAVQAQGGEALILHGDVADKAQAESLVERFVEHFGGIDALVNNAGSAMNGSILTLTDEDWHRTLGVHVNGAFYCTRAAARHMVKQKHGRIVNMSSVAALRGVPNATAYAMVKAALVSFTQCTAMDLADHGITVNAVCPGLIDTDFHAATPPDKRAYNTEKRVPLHRYGTAQEVADAVIFMLQSDFITGETIVVDGGMSMRITQ